MVASGTTFCTGLRETRIRQGTGPQLEASQADSQLSKLLIVLAALDLELIVRVRGKKSAKDTEEIF